MVEWAGISRKRGPRSLANMNYLGVSAARSLRMPRPPRRPIWIMRMDLVST